MADNQSHTAVLQEEGIDESYYVASQWQLMWRKFRKHRLAMVGGMVTILIYLVVAFAEFLAPFPGVAFSSEYTYAPPQPLHLFDRTPEGRRFSPYVNGYKVAVHPVAMKKMFLMQKKQFFSSI